MGRALPMMEEDKRLMPILGHLDKQYGQSYATSAVAGEIQAQDVDGVRLLFIRPTCRNHSSFGQRLTVCVLFLTFLSFTFVHNMSLAFIAQGPYASLHGASA